MSWQAGPLPPSTYNWGGIVTKDCYASGFVFADFCGDHATVQDDTGFFGRRVEAADVLWFNNALDLPPCCVKGQSSGRLDKG